MLASSLLLSPVMISLARHLPGGGKKRRKKKKKTSPTAKGVLKNGPPGFHFKRLFSSVCLYPSVNTPFVSCFIISPARRLIPDNLLLVYVLQRVQTMVLGGQKVAPAFSEPPLKQPRGRRRASPRPRRVKGRSRRQWVPTPGQLRSRKQRPRRGGLGKLSQCFQVTVTSRQREGENLK